MFDYMYDDMDMRVDKYTKYLFVKDGETVGELIAETRKPWQQALDLRDEKFPGAKVFVNVTEYIDEKKEEVSEDVAA